MELSERVNRVYQAYNLGPVNCIGVLGENRRNNLSLLVESGAGLHVVREYRRNRCLAAIEYEHATIRGLTSKLPVVSLLAMPDGATIAEVASLYYAVFDFIHGAPYVDYDSRHRMSAARMLGQLHCQTRSLALPSDRPCWGSLPDFDWLCHGSGSLQDLVDAISQRNDLELLRAAQAVQAWLYQWHDAFDCDQLPKLVIHGDWVPNNLKFTRDGEVKAIFDFDNVRRERRVVELGPAVRFAWTGRRFDRQLATTFIRLYETTSWPLSSAERSLLIPAVKGRLLQTVVWNLDLLVRSPEHERARRILRFYMDAASFAEDLGHWL